VEIRDLVEIVKSKGRVRIREGSGKILEFIALDNWSEANDDQNGIFLIFDVFQLRSISEQFADVSLDIIEYATKPTIYHTIKGRFLKNGPVKDGQIKFSLIKKDFWNKLLFSYTQVLILQYVSEGEVDFETADYFPLLSAGTKEMFLSPDGDIKIFKG
jgi:hypothetical protein